MRILTSAAAIAAIALAGFGEPVSARPAQEIYGPVFGQYSSITKARKKLRSKEKKEALTGDEFFALAHACMYEEPKGPSKIMNALSRSKCKDQVADYFVKAGMAGTPEGFLSAARMMGSGDAAYMYALTTYRLAGDDVQLADEALEWMGRLKPSVANVDMATMQGEGLATGLAQQGFYSAVAAAPDAATMARVDLPQLDWLDFTSPKRCTWSETAQSVLTGSYSFGEPDWTTKPASVRVPGIAEPVRGRVSRPYGDNYVVIDTDFKGRWLGLTVLGLTDALLEESHGVYGTGIRFQEPVSEVAAALARAGFVVNADGSERQQVDRAVRIPYTDERGRQQVAVNIDGVVTSIKREGDESVFYCNEMFEASYGDG